MAFRDVVFSWFDANDLMGRRPNPSINEEGNPILETSIAYCFLVWRGESQPEDRDRFTKSLNKFRRTRGLPNKKPGSNELVTFDDLIGLCAASHALESNWAREIVGYGLRNGWQFSNNGDVTYTGQTKPWHRAFYLWSADIDPGLWDNIFLSISIASNALFGMEHASGKRLTYLMVKTIKGKSILCDLAIILWWYRVRKVYGSAKRIFIMYNHEGHPFSQYCPD